MYKSILLVIFLIFSVRIFWPAQSNVFHLLQPLPLSSSKTWNLVQKWRESQDLPEYTKDDLLCKFALIRVKEIQTDWSHDGFNTQISEKLPNTYTKAGENLVTGFPTEATSLNKWLHSPEHLKNLEDNFQKSCIVCDKLYCVQEFASY